MGEDRVTTDLMDALERSLARCGFTHEHRACGRPMGHEGQHTTWTWFCHHHHSWLCQAGQGKCPSWTTEPEHNDSSPPHV